MIHLQGGADSGYGAKAQEVLGQVRGRYVKSVLHVYEIRENCVVIFSFILNYMRVLPNSWNSGKGSPVVYNSYMLGLGGKCTQLYLHFHWWLNKLLSLTYLLG